MAKKKITQKAPGDSRRVNEKNFCYFPFSQLLLQPTGLISPCCWNQDFIAGEIQKENVMEIWNGEKMRNLRAEFLAGKPVICEKQMRHMGCHKWSHRLGKKGLDLMEVQPYGPRRLDLRLNGRCNLKCVMCDVWRQPNGLYEKSNFWEVAPKEIFPYLLEMDVLGGEPLIQHDTYRLIREVSSVNSGCTWAFVTNGQYKFGPVVREHLDLLNIRWIQVSIDSLNPETYKAIRPGAGDLFKVIQTLKDLLEYRYERLLLRRGFNITASICVQQKNWSELGDFLEYARDLKVEPVVQFAYIPDSESILAFDRLTRQKILAHYEDLLDSHEAEHLMPVILPLRDSLKAAGDELIKNELAKDVSYLKDASEVPAEL